MTFKKKRSVKTVKLLRVIADGFKGCAPGFTIDFVARSRRTPEDCEYELQEVAENLYVYNTLAIVGKNASGKTSAIELLDACYTILGDFHLSSKPYRYEGAKLSIDFFHDGCIYRYHTVLKDADAMATKAEFSEQRIWKKRYYKSKAKSVYDDAGFTLCKTPGGLPNSMSEVFFILKKTATYAVYFDSFGKGADTYQLTFAKMKDFGISPKILEDIILIFDENIRALSMATDDHTFRVDFGDGEELVSDRELFFRLSSGTTKGILLYILMVAALKEGFVLLVDEVENHFHKTLVENMLALFKDKSVNRARAELVFTTHDCELLDLFNRQDNIFVARATPRIQLANMYTDFDIRSELLKSRQFYANAFETAVNYDALMRLKRDLL